MFPALDAILPKAKATLPKQSFSSSHRLLSPPKVHNLGPQPPQPCFSPLDPQQHNGSSSSAPGLPHHPKAMQNPSHPCSQLTFKGFRWGFASLNLWGKHAFAKNLSIKTCIIEGDLGVFLQLLGQVGPGGCWDHVGPVASVLRDLQLLHKAHRPEDETMNNSDFSFPQQDGCWEGTKCDGDTWLHLVPEVLLGKRSSDSPFDLPQQVCIWFGPFRFLFFFFSFFSFLFPSLFKQNTKVSIPFKTISLQHFPTAIKTWASLTNGTHATG